jgi:hypothetical protein
MYTKEQLNDAHEHTQCNKTELLNSEKIGCCFCGKIFTTNENNIESFPSIVDRDEVNRTMICPHCYVDALIGDASGYKITKDFLNEMNESWFATGEEMIEGLVESTLSELGDTIEKIKENFFGVASTLIHHYICKNASSGYMRTPEDEVEHTYERIDDWYRGIYDYDEPLPLYTLWKSRESELINYAKSLQDEVREICIKQANRRSKINDLLRERLTKANFPLYFINNSNCVLCDEVVQASIYFSKTHYLDVEVAAKDFEDSLGSIVVSALALSQMKNVSKVRVVQEEWDDEWE